MRRNWQRLIMAHFVLLASGLGTVALGQPQPLPRPPFPPPSPPPVYQQPQSFGVVGFMCATRLGACQMSAAGPINAPCTCYTSSGPVYGQIFR